MPAICVVGLQWGDEAKGKIVDYLTDQHDIVVRYQGGSNAGHSVMVGDRMFKFHLVPSGILHQNTTCLIANGVVLDPGQLIKEIDDLIEGGFAVHSNLKISDRAHVVFPYHRLQDELAEKARGKGAIGTTGRGIGPCYMDKIARQGIRVGDLCNTQRFRERLQDTVETKNRLLQALYEAEPLSWERIFEEYSAYADRLRPHVCDTGEFLHQSLTSGKRVLLEGAQGSLLDIDHGTYPYVTSSNSSATGITAGAGIAPRWIDKSLGVMKAYSTRVGNGPFPTELEDANGQRMRERGKEYGTTTGRARRCGWLDAVATRYSVELGGIDAVALMLLDVLSGFDKLYICVAYEYQGQTIRHFPSDLDILEQCTPVYEEFSGWQPEIDQVRAADDLPAETRQYVTAVEQLLGVPVAVASVGPERSQTIFFREFP